MASTRPGRVTMLDVAEKSGVSYQTVSRVINDHPNVAPATRKRVLWAIRELNYQPSKMARGLATRRSNTLAVITYSLKYYGPAQMVVNIEQSARAAGYDLIFSNVDPAVGEDIQSAIERINQWAVDGIMLIAPVDHNQYERLAQAFTGAPLIQVDIRPGTNVPSIILDQHAGSWRITRHLIEQGHRRIAEIAGPSGWYGATARHEGFTQALRETDLVPATAQEGDWSAASGYAAAHRILETADITALVVANDQMALGALRALNERGRRVPADVSLVGFDDIPEAAYFTPPLTTIRQDFSRVGREGLQYLIECIQDPANANGQRVIEPELVVRNSTTSPPDER